MEFAKETRPIVLICGCRKYREYLDAAIRRMDRPKWRTLGIVGDPDCGTPHLEGQILTLPVSDTYETLPLKLYTAYKWVYDNFPNTPGLYKTDDDIVYPSMKDLTKALTKLQDKPYWGLFVGTCVENNVHPIRIAERFDDKTLTPRHQSAVYTYGAGYWLNRKALAVVSSSEKDYKQSCLEDVCTGHVLNRAGWKPLHVPVAFVEVPRGPELLAAK